MMLASLLAFAGAAAALPQRETRNNGEHINVNWEDFSTLPLLGTLSPPGTFKEIDYTGWEVLQTGIGGFVLTGLDVSSPPNAIASGLQDQPLHGPPTMKAGEDISCFDFEKFHFGCALDLVTSALSVAPSCRVTVTGYDEYGNGVANQQFEFVATGLKNEMVEAKLCGDFKRVSRVEFSTASTLNVLTALLLDDIQYTAFRK